jgi:hypothetical protein
MTSSNELIILQHGAFAANALTGSLSRRAFAAERAGVMLFSEPGLPF